MRKFSFAAAVAILSIVALAGCGGNSMSMPAAGGNTVPVNFTIRDNPPTGVTVLSFEIQVTGASLEPTNTTNPTVSLLDEPTEVELEDLQTDSALLANDNVPAGSYSGLKVGFANPRLTILNQTGGTITVGGKNCLTAQVCELTPTLNSATATVAAPTAPFPIVLSMNTAVELRLDFNVNTSIQQSDLSITPMISLTQIQKPVGENEDEIRVLGFVTGVDTTMSTLTVKDAFTGNPSTFKTNGETEFDFEDSCGAENLSCVKVGQVVKVEAQQLQDGSLLADEVELIADVNQAALAGTVTSINSGANSFQIVIASEEGFGENSMPGDPIGMPLTINLAAGTTFSIDANGLALPAGLNFAGLGDLMVGQRVRVHPTALTVTGTPPNLMITADQVHLEAGQVTGSVTATNPGATPPSFTLGSLPPLFINSGTSAINVDVLSTTGFEDVSGLSGLNVGDRVSVRGLLFHSTTPPTLVAEKVVKQEAE